MVLDGFSLACSCAERNSRFDACVNGTSTSIPPADILAASGGTGFPLWVNTLFLLAFLLVFRVLGYLVLRYFRRPTQGPFHEKPNRCKRSSAIDLFGFDSFVFLRKKTSLWTSSFELVSATRPPSSSSSRTSINRFFNLHSKTKSESNERQPVSPNRYEKQSYPTVPIRTNLVGIIGILLVQRNQQQQAQQQVQYSTVNSILQIYDIFFVQCHNDGSDAVGCKN